MLPHNLKICDLGDPEKMKYKCGSDALYRRRRGGLPKVFDYKMSLSSYGGKSFDRNLTRVFMPTWAANALGDNLRASTPSPLN